MKILTREILVVLAMGTLSPILGMDESLTPLPAYDWGKYFQMPFAPGGQTESVRGNQVLHTKSTNKRSENDAVALEFVNDHLTNAKPCISDAGVLKHAVEVALRDQDGFWLEMGVGMGRTINFIAALVAEHPSKIQVHGFDSFEGLSEDWDKGDKVFPQGAFASRDPAYLPPYLNNVLLYKGVFKQTLPKFRDEILKKQPIRFLHVDSDSYTPASEIFRILEKNIMPGTVIVFDELYNYPNYEQHEWKALCEFLSRTGYQVDYLAYNTNHEQVAIRILPAQKEKL